MWLCSLHEDQLLLTFLCGINVSKIALIVQILYSIDGMLMTYLLFSSFDHVEKLQEYLSPKHPNTNFPFEKENDGRLSFLDIKIVREKGKFITNVYRKKGFSIVYTNSNNLMPETCKTGLIKSLIFQCYSLCVDLVRFHYRIH